MLEIFLFGLLELCYNDERLPPLPTQKATSLIGYLITKPNKHHAREVLAEMLWPDANPQRSRNNLNTALWQIRGMFKSGSLEPDQYILADSKSICWNPQVETWIDIDVFEHGCADASLQAMERAAGLYSGPFLSDVYDEWCLEKRYALEEKYQGLLLRMIKTYQTSAQYPEMLNTARTLLAVEPLHEEAVLGVVTSHYQMGNRAAAVQFYQQWRKKLNKELGIEPSRELRALYEAMVREKQLADPNAAPAG